MLKGILSRSLLLLATAIPFAAFYYAPWLKTEWDIGSGSRAFHGGDFQGAIKHLSPAIKVLEQSGNTERLSVIYWNRPDYPAHLRHVLAQSHLAVLNGDEALPHFRRLIQSRPADSKPHFVLGLDALKRKDWEASIYHLKRTVELERDCVVCASALKNAEDARGSHERSVEARLAQGTALKMMTPAAMCIAYLAAVTATSTAATAALGTLHPSFVKVVRKTGTTKKLAEAAIKTLEQQISSEVLKLLALVQRDFCPQRVSDDASVKDILDWVELAPFASDAHRLSIAAVQVWELTKHTAVYGRAFSAERDSIDELAAAEIASAVDWDRLVSASKDPKFIERGLASIAVLDPVRQRSRIGRTLDVLNPMKWF